MANELMSWEQLVAAGRLRIAARARSEAKVTITTVKPFFHYQALFAGGKQTLVRHDASSEMIAIWGSVEFCGGKA